MMRLSRLILQKMDRKRVAADIVKQMMIQARQPGFFGKGGFSDTLEGRFECVTLHSVLVTQRLQRCGSRGGRLAQAVTDHLFDSFDHSLRETGAGDFTVVRKIRKLGENFSGRIKAYSVALNDETVPLRDVLARNLFDVVSSEPFFDTLETYMQQTTILLNGLEDSAILAGKLVWSSIDTADLTTK